MPHLVIVRGGVFSLSPELATVIGQLAPATALDPSVGSFDLPDVDKNNGFEHDASLSRVDFVFSGIPGDANFDPGSLCRSHVAFVGVDYITILAAAAGRYNRVQISTC